MNNPNQPLIVNVQGETIGLTEKQHLKSLTMTEFIAHLLEVSPYGLMAPIFILEAIRYYAERVASQDEPANNPDEPLNPKAWHAVATHINDQIKLRHEE